MAEKKEKVGFFTRIGNFFRALKSEFHKIVWAPWKQVRKSTIVVIIALVVCAAFIGVLDWVFSKSIVLLSDLVS